MLLLATAVVAETLKSCLRLCASREPKQGFPATASLACACLGAVRVHSQEYVLEQIRLFAVEFAQQLVPQITQQHLDLAFSRALYALSARTSQQALKLQLRFTHKCK